ncbi:MAG TPA: PhzF family phenazine biosynthesis protein [Polyangiaceae bacterium]|nr:PhzF family phenazine biosynthesis protein [Polyangiaceae bacterium]
MRPLSYVVCDVFTDRPLTGNALAVFTDASHLSCAQMQALAREMNLSETSFVVPPSADADAGLRIFTPTMELPFAGHPTLGTALVLARSSGDAVRLETGRGVVTVRFEAGTSGKAFGWMTQPLPKREPFVQVRELFTALGVREATVPVELYDNGPRYVLVELETPAEVAGLSPDLSALAAFGSLAFVVFSRRGERWKVRVFAPGEGIPEDPGTGAAAGALAVHLTRHGRVAFATEFVIEQGAEISRPSTLHARAFGNAEQPTLVEVGGSGVIVARGEFTAY